MEKILSISRKLNFTPNTLGCYGLTKNCYTHGSIANLESSIEVTKGRAADRSKIEPLKLTVYRPASVTYFQL